VDEVAKVAWARAKAEELRAKADSTNATNTPVTGALESLRREAGETSHFYLMGKLGQHGQWTWVGAARRTAGALYEWADIVEAGLGSSEPFEVRARRATATDLMEQARAWTARCA